MNKKIYLSLGLLSVIAKGYSQENIQPNILCIVCEDISPILGCYGDKVAVTPNLDKLAKESIRYNMYTSVGVSAPSRYSLITGRYPSADGANYMRTQGLQREKPKDITPYEVILPPEVKCYTEYLRKAGYFCTNNAKTDYQFAAPITAWDENSNKAHWKHRPKDKPFFSIFNLEVTHEGQVWERKVDSLTVEPSDIQIPPYYPDTETVRHDMAIAYSNVAKMDQQSQKLIDELIASDELDNTIIIWYSDNGGPLPRQKREIYESGMLVPFMVRFPDKFRAGEFDDELVAFVDIPATILSLAGIRPPQYMHGNAFLGKYRGKTRKYVYGARDRMDECVDKQGCVRDKRFRYIRNYYPERPGYMNVGYRLSMPMMREILNMYEKGLLNQVQSRWFETPRPKEEFYDVVNDPHEINNLINDPKYKKHINRLRKAYDKWNKKYNALWKLDEHENIARIHPNGIQPQTASPVIEEKNGWVSIRCSTPGASIAYKLGEDDCWWHLYDKPFQVSKGVQVKGVASRIGYKQSEIKELVIK